MSSTSSLVPLHLSLVLFIKATNKVAMKLETKKTLNIAIIYGMFIVLAKKTDQMQNE